MVVYGPVPPKGSTVNNEGTTVPKKFVGPTRPGTDVEHFRKTGETKPEPRQFVGPTRPGTDVEHFRKTGKIRTIGGGGRRTRPSVDQAEEAKKQAEQEAQKKLIEEMRKAGEKRAAEEAAKRTQTALRTQPLVSSLRAREQIRIEAEERGRGFTRLELQRRLKELGTSQAEFRKASRTAREQFKKTGVSITEQIRIEAEKKRVKELKVTRKEFEPSMVGFKPDSVIIGPINISQAERDRLRREPEIQAIKTSFLEKVKDLPVKLFEDVTGRKPREAFRFITGAQETDITQPLTIKEVTTEATQVPIRGVSIIAEFAGAGAEKITPESRELFTIQKQETSFLEPQFGTITTGAPRGFIKRKTTIPERIIATPTPKQVRATVKIGTELVATSLAPMIFAPGFVTEGVGTTLDKEKTIGERALGAVEAGLGGFIIGEKAVKFLRTPIVTTRAARPIRKPKAFKVQAEKTIKGKPEIVSVLEIRGEVRPPIIIEETTRGRQILDFFGKQAEKIVRVGEEPMVSSRFKPKVTIIPAKPYIIKTPKLAIGDKPFVVVEVIGGRKFATISKIEGVSKKISLTEFNRLSKEEQFLLQERAIQMTGRHVPLKQVPVILSKEAERTTSLIRSQPLVRITPGKRVATIREVPGKRRPLLHVAVTEVEKKAKIDAGKLIKTSTLFKDITFEKQILKGKPKELETITLRLKPKPSDGDAVRSMQLADIKKTPYTKTFQDVKMESLAAKITLPKQEIIKPSKVILEQPAAKIEKAVSSMAGVSGTQAESIFAGTGQYEVTTQQQVATTLKTTRPQVIQFNKLSTMQAKEQIQQPKQISIQLQPQIQKGRKALRQKQLQPQVEILKSEATQIEVAKQQQLGVQKLSIISKQLVKPQLQPIIQRLKIPTPKPKPTPKPIQIPTTTPLLKRLAVKAENGELFEVFTRKGGKDVRVAKAKTEVEAFKKLKKKLKGSLRASGFVQKGKRKIAPPILLNGEFRRSKVDKFRIVEKKAKRLRKTTTGKEIQLFRAFGSTKKKSKKKTGLFGF